MFTLAAKSCALSFAKPSSEKFGLVTGNGGGAIPISTILIGFANYVFQRFTYMVSSKTVYTFVL